MKITQLNQARIPIVKIDKKLERFRANYKIFFFPKLKLKLTPPVKFQGLGS